MRSGPPGCVSEGTTEEEALANMADAVREYMEVATRTPPACESGKSRSPYKACPRSLDPRRQSPTSRALVGERSSGQSWTYSTSKSSLVDPRM